ncbi:MAG: hypothetical protein AB7O97_20760 [Planctomycetota bacterium]
MRRSGRVLLPVLAAALLSGCVRLAYVASSREEPIDRAALARLVPGSDDLASCLRLLGAPHFVWEYRGSGVALGWYHLDRSGWGVDVSYSPFRNAPGASLSFDWDTDDLPGAVLWFDGDLRLTEWREGSMRQLTSGLRRPASIDEDR